MRNFIQELKRRKVLRVAVAYVVASWVLLQVADLLSDILELPEWTARLVLVILAIGFVPSLILAWAYDLTPDAASDNSGTAATKRPTANKTPAILAIGLAVVIEHDQHLRLRGVEKLWSFVSRRATTGFVWVSGFHG